MSKKLIIKNKTKQRGLFFQKEKTPINFINKGCLQERLLIKSFNTQKSQFFIKKTVSKGPIKFLKNFVLERCKRLKRQLFLLLKLKTFNISLKRKHLKYMLNILKKRVKFLYTYFVKEATKQELLKKRILKNFQLYYFSYLKIFFLRKRNFFRVLQFKKTLKKFQSYKEYKKHKRRKKN